MHVAMVDLDGIRQSLDSLDREIVAALARRDDFVRQVADLKRGGALNTVRDAQREEALLERVARMAGEKGLSADYVTRLYRDILDHSVRRQDLLLAGADTDIEQRTVAYQGTQGSYSHVAANRHFASHAGRFSFAGMANFRQVVDEVVSGRAQFGCLPIENTTAGSINDTYDLLAAHDLAVVGEEILRIEHCVLALDKIDLSRIRRVYSQAPALAQCSDFLYGLDHCQAVSWTDTALSAEKVARDQDLSQAAIASEEAGRLYGLTVIARDIANNHDNYTRWAVVTTQQVEYDLRTPCKTSLVIATKDEHGALLECLKVLSAHGLNLTKLESRPRPGVVWEYLFYLDFEGNLAQPEVQSALAALKPHVSYLKPLGSYPKRQRP
jgi:chorismate mutase / prephenate dehydratase